MDVRCERCKTEYELDDSRITEAGVAVKCSQCSHIFRVKKKALVFTVPMGRGEVAEGSLLSLEGGARQLEWKVRQSSGGVLRFRDLAALQKWIVEKKVVRTDEVSLSGETWKQLGDLAELASFFHLVEQAQREPARSSPVAATVPEPQPTDDAPALPSLRPSVGSRAFRLVLFLGVVAGLTYTGYQFYYLPKLLEQRRMEEALRATREQLETERQLAAQKEAQARAQAEEELRRRIVEPEAAAAPLDAGPLAAEEPERAQVDYAAALRRGDALRTRDNPSAALGAYDMAAKLAPEAIEPAVGRALALLDLGRPSEAEAEFQKVLAVDPRSGAALIGLAEVYRVQGKTGEAIAAYRRYLEVLPGGPDASVARGAIDKLERR